MKTMHTYFSSKWQALGVRAFALSCLFAFALSCSDELPYDLPTPPAPPPMGEHDTYITIKGLGISNTAATSTRSVYNDDEDNPLVHSIRVIVFHGTNPAAQMVTNDAKILAPGVDEPISVKKVDGVWQLNTDQFRFVVATAASPTTGSGKSTVWIILNELNHQVSLIDKKTGLPAVMNLTDTLSKVTTLGDMNNLAQYSTVWYDGTIQGILGNTEHLARLAANYQEVALPTEVGGKPTSLLHPFVVNFSGTDILERTMAKVTLLSLTNDPTGISHADPVDKTSLIYITEIGVRNMARWHKWNPNKLPTGLEYNATNFLGFNSANPGENTWFQSSVKPPTGYFNRKWKTGAEGNMTLTLNYKEPSTILYEYQIPTISRLYYTGESSRPFSINAFELDDHLRQWFLGNRWNIEQMPNQKWYSTLTGSWSQTNPGEAPPMDELGLQLFKNAIKVMMNDYHLQYSSKGGQAAFSIEGGVWELTDAPVSLFVPEYIIDPSAPTPPTELFITAVRAKLPTEGDKVIGVLDDGGAGIFTNGAGFGDMMVVLERDKDGNIVREKKVDELQQEDVKGMWGSIPGAVQLGTTGRPSIVRHYWDIEVYRMRSVALTAGQSIAITKDRFTNSNLIQEPFTASISITDGETTGDYNIYRNTHYQFGMVIVEDLPPNSPASRSSQSGGRWGFSLRREF